MKEGNEIIAHNIKFLRKREKENQQEFGERYGTDQKSMSVYERGEFRPKPEFLFALSRHVGIPAEILLTIKLKANREGKIINMPSAEKEIQEIRIKLKEVKATFQEHVWKLFEEIDILNERLDLLQKMKRK